MKKISEEHQKLIIDCTLLFDRLHRNGLHVTAQKMHDVVRQIGFEVAEIIGKKL